MHARREDFEHNRNLSNILMVNDDKAQAVFPVNPGAWPCLPVERDGPLALGDGELSTRITWKRKARSVVKRLLLHGNTFLAPCPCSDSSRFLHAKALLETWRLHVIPSTTQSRSAPRDGVPVYISLSPFPQRSSLRSKSPTSPIIVTGDLDVGPGKLGSRTMGLGNDRSRRGGGGGGREMGGRKAGEL